MKLVAYYLVIMLLTLLTLLLLTLSGVLPEWLMEHVVIIKCSLIGGFGAVSYAFAAIYYHYCRKQDWEEIWIPWYFIRPVLGLIIGGFTYFFVAGGLLVLAADANINPNELTVFALAFIGGLNTDRFIAKIEDVVSNVWGIIPSSLSRELIRRDKQEKDITIDEQGNKGDKTNK